MRVVVTGPTGFIGRRTLSALVAAGHHVIAAARSIPAERDGSVEWRAIGGLETPLDWSPVLAGADAIVHLAGIAHVLDATDEALATRYRAINCEATLALARAAIACGVRRLVFMSSIRVHGNAPNGVIFRETDTCVPSDEYGRSKLDAETGLGRIAQTSALEVVSLRPPLVYGPGVGANFLRLLQWADRGVPLPLGAIRNRRSLIYIDNLTAAIELALVHARTAGQTFLVSDAEDVSTPELLRRMARAAGKSAKLFPVPPSLLRIGLRLIGRGSDYARLCADAALDSAHIRATLGFRPPFTLDAGLAETVKWYRSRAPSGAR